MSPSPAPMKRPGTAPRRARGQPNGGTHTPALSADGRFVAFVSDATNLVPGDTNTCPPLEPGTHRPGECPDVFVYDRTTAVTTRVSVSSSGEQANYESGFCGPSISADGRLVAFASYASNLVAADQSVLGGIYVHDRKTRMTTRVSISSSGEQANGESMCPSISADGRFVAFTSVSNNLVPGDTNDAQDVFVHDREARRTTRVSVSSLSEQANDYSGSNERPAISDDGRYVAFSSAAFNLVPGDTNMTVDVFVHDRKTGETTRVSVSSSGEQGDRGSGGPAISADGRYVGFTSGATNLVPTDTNSRADVFVHDRETGATTRVSVSSSGGTGNEPSHAASISADGRYVAFVSDASNLVPGDTNACGDPHYYPRCDDVFVHDRATGRTVRASVSSSEKQGNGPSGGARLESGPAISSDGRFVAFSSGATNLVRGDTNGVEDVFVRDRALGVTVRVSVPSGG